MKFKPFRLLLPMLSPVVVTAFSPSLDGILFESLKQRAPMKSDEEIRTWLKQYLAFNDELGVFHGSALKFGVSRESALIVSEYSRVDVLCEGKLSSDMYAPNGGRGLVKTTYLNILVTGGPTKKRLTKRPAYSAQYSVFDGMGDPQGVVDLLQNTFVGVGYDAQNCGMGSFNTEQIELYTLNEDESLIKDGNAMRLLPEGTAEGVSSVSVTVPPYYLKTGAPCVAPPRIQIFNIDTL